MIAPEHWTDPAALESFAVEFYVVQRRRPRPGVPDEWVDVPGSCRADDVEAFELAASLERDFPRTVYRVVRRWKGRA